MLLIELTINDTTAGAALGVGRRDDARLEEPGAGPDYYWRLVLMMLIKPFYLNSLNKTRASSEMSE